MTRRTNRAAPAVLSGKPLGLANDGNWIDAYNPPLPLAL